MNTTYQPQTPLALETPATPKAIQPQADSRFCPSIFCFTDEISVRRVSAKADVWLLTDEGDAQSWLMMGSEPVCPHCGTRLL
jgi:hypothetical protein